MVQSSSCKMSLLWRGCRDGDSDRVRTALEGGEGVNTRGGRDNSTCLGVAVQNGHVGLVHLLLEHPDIDVNCVDRGGLTALHMACFKGQESVARALVAARGQDSLNLASFRALTPLMTAVLEGNPAVVELLLEQPSLEVNCAGDKGNTALHLACLEGRRGIVHRLLAAPGQQSFNVQNSAGNTPLMCGVKKSHSDVVDLLLAQPAVLEGLQARNTFGNTPLMLATKKGRLEYVKQLVELPGVDLETRDWMGGSLEEGAG